MQSELTMSEAMQSSEGSSARGPSVDPNGRLHTLASVALQTAIDAQDAGRETDSDVRAFLCRTCALARERGIRAEQLLVILKQVWYELPEVRHAPRHDGSRVLTRVITHCIHEYYRAEEQTSAANLSS